jgi:hypothetical protein
MQTDCFIKIPQRINYNLVDLLDICLNDSWDDAYHHEEFEGVDLQIRKDFKFQYIQEFMIPPKLIKYTEGLALYKNPAGSAEVKRHKDTGRKASLMAPIWPLDYPPMVFYKDDKEYYLDNSDPGAVYLNDHMVDHSGTATPVDRFYLIASFKNHSYQELKELCHI